MIAEGHQVASHTWAHQRLTDLTADQVRDQMLFNEVAFNDILGYFPTYMRCVHGPLASRALACTPLDRQIQAALLGQQRSS